MRLAAAIMVIFSHAFPIVGLAEPRSFLNPTGKSWGDLGVLVFFSISGYLIAGSWLKEPKVGRYWLKRVLRILPGVAAATIMSAWLLGPLVTDDRLTDYFAHSGTWLYPIQESLLFVPPHFEPPGVFDGNPLGDINASLWTLPVEVACYLGLMLLLTFKLNRPAVLVGVTLVFALIGSDELLSQVGVKLTDNKQIVQSATFIATFISGTALYLWRDKIKLNGLWAAGAFALVVGLGFTPVGTTAAPFLLPYVILTIGFKAPVLPLGRYRGWDLSYGTYVLAFPIEQAVLKISGFGNPWFVAITALLIVLPLAALSWYFIERRALALIPLRGIPSRPAVVG